MSLGTPFPLVILLVATGLPLLLAIYLFVRMKDVGQRLKTGTQRLEALEASTNRQGTWVEELEGQMEALEDRFPFTGLTDEVENTQVESTTKRLDHLETMLAEYVAVARRLETHCQTIMRRLDALDTALGEQGSVQLETAARLAQLESQPSPHEALKQLQIHAGRIQALEARPPPASVEPLKAQLTTLEYAQAEQAFETQQTIEALESRVYGVENSPAAPNPQEALATISDRLNTLQDSFKAITQEGHVDVLKRIEELAARMAALETRPVSPPPAPPKGRPTVTGLQQIKGIGQAIERALNEAGIVRIEQIAQWTPTDIETYGQLRSGLKARIERDQWVVQAKRLTQESKATPPAIDALPTAPAPAAPPS